MIRAYIDGSGNMHVNAEGERAALCAEAAMAVAAVTERFAPEDRGEETNLVSIIMEIAGNILEERRRGHGQRA